jgi:hypothetical protein
VSNRFAALKDLDTEVETNCAWKKIRENIKISAKESLGYSELKEQGAEQGIWTEGKWGEGRVEKTA